MTGLRPPGNADASAWVSLTRSLASGLAAAFALSDLFDEGP